MFKITTHIDRGTAILTLEGRLTDPWVKELECCWREAVQVHRQPVLVDLKDLTFIAPEGKALLTQMWHQGATFRAAGCLNTSIVEEITGNGRAHPPDRTAQR